MSAGERLPPSNEVRQQAGRDAVEMLVESLAHAPGDTWEPPPFSRQGVVNLLHYIEGLRLAARR